MFLQDVARAIERDFAAISREDPLGFGSCFRCLSRIAAETSTDVSIERRITEFKKATKALRSAEVVSAIAQGDIDSFDDGGAEVGHLKSLEKYMRRWKPKPTE